MMVRVDDLQVGLQCLFTQRVEPGGLQAQVAKDGQAVRIEFLGGRDGRRAHGAHAAMTGWVPTIVVRCITRRSAGSYDVT